MKRKIFIGFISLSVILFLLLSGCGGSKETGKSTEQKDIAKQEQSQPTQSPDEENKTPDQAKGSEKVQSEEMSQMGDRLATTYKDLMASGKYYMKYRMTANGETIEAEIAYKGDDFATKTVMDGIENRMVVKDQKMYLIDSETKTVTIMSSDPIEEEEDVNYAGLVFVKEGKEDFLGQTLPYEEYSEDGFLVKYFFQGNKLVGMEITDEESTQVLEILELSDNIPPIMFDIPADYEQQNIG
ncbi:MAG: hypothetical protein GX091_03425 [Peptococcaceae bacterium]|nr:hypothetical protein [Peptococcaceae bacterium]